MPKSISVYVLLLSALFVIPVGPVGAQKDQATKKGKLADTVQREETTPQDYANLANLNEVTGRITNISVKDGAMTFTIEWSHWEINADAAANPKGNAAKSKQKDLQLRQQIARDYDKIIRTKNPVQRQQALMQFQVHLQKLQAAAGNTGPNLQKMFAIVKSSKDFDLELKEGLKVARKQLLPRFTDEGERINFTPDELKKLKSPDVPGGYTAAPEDLSPGQTVHLHLSPPRKENAQQSAKDSQKSGAASGYTKDQKSLDALDKLMPGANQLVRPRVRLVLILEEAPPLPEPKELPKKKKKT